jgi:hypothetical protein
MNQNYDFIIQNMVWSFSRANSFHQCPYMWLMQYIYCVDKENNFFAEYGSFYHLILEKFFKDELEIYELADYYQDHYAENVITEPPPYPAGMAEKYYNAGIDFFMNFDFDKEKYEVLYIEAEIPIQIDKYNIVVKPDLVLRNKKTEQNELWDYKTSDIFRGKDKPTDHKKLQEYMNQMNLYCKGIKEKLDIQIDVINLWFVRLNRLYSVKFDQASCEASYKWFLNEIHKIEKETEWNATPQDYFCNHICSVKHLCDKR